jgi:hypothetical protein
MNGSYLSKTYGQRNKKRNPCTSAATIKNVDPLTVEEQDEKIRAMVR